MAQLYTQPQAPTIPRPDIEVRSICEGTFGDGDEWIEPHTIVRRGEYVVSVEGERRGYDLCIRRDQRDIVNRAPFTVIDHATAVEWVVRQLGGRA